MIVKDKINISKNNIKSHSNTNGSQMGMNNLSELNVDNYLRIPKYEMSTRKVQNKKKMIKIKREERLIARTSKVLPIEKKLKLEGTPGSHHELQSLEARIYTQNVTNSFNLLEGTS